MNGRQTIQFANKKKVSSWPVVASTDLHNGDDHIETKSVGASMPAELMFCPDSALPAEELRHPARGKCCDRVVAKQLK
jgi:hypothetical protein